MAHALKTNAPQKTNASRLLDKAGIVHTLVPYAVDPDNLAADHVAASLGEDIELVYKTLVLHGNVTGYFVCVLPGDREVDLKKAAKVSGNKKAELIPMKDLLAVTGYIRGGCSPVGMKKPFPTIFHVDALSHEAVYVSAGVRGLQMCVNPKQLINYVGAAAADICTEAHHE